jgi:hypothetical protein
MVSEMFEPSGFNLGASLIRGRKKFGLEQDKTLVGLILG